MRIHLCLLKICCFEGLNGPGLLNQMYVYRRPYKSNLVRLHTDKDTGRPKGYAHVHFPDALSLEK